MSCIEQMNKIKNLNKMNISNIMHFRRNLILLCPDKAFAKQTLKLQRIERKEEEIPVSQADAHGLVECSPVAFSRTLRDKKTNKTKQKKKTLKTKLRR